MQIISKEDLLNYMRSGSIHISKKDYGFYNNLYYLVKDRRGITSNQSKLFDKLIVKYKRQLKNNGLDHNILLNTKWTTEVIETKPEFLEAWITLCDDILTVRCPFNSKFIKDIRNVEVVDFLWSKEDRVYKTEFSTIALKKAYEILQKHFTTIKFSEDITKLMNQLACYSSVKYWNPTYVKINKNYYIVATNQFVHKELSNISFDDSLATLNTLALAGVTIDNSVLGEDKSKRFASTFFSEFDIQEFYDVCKWLQLLKVDTVIASRDVIHNKPLLQEIKTKLKEHDINLVTDTNQNGKNKVLLRTFRYSQTNLQDITKVILLLNSRPILLKNNQ